MTKDMKNVLVALQIFPKCEKALHGCKFVNCHMVIGVKINNFRRKAHRVLEGHVTQIAEVVTYSSMVTRETTDIALTMSALHDLKVEAADVLNAYVMTP